MAYFFVDLFIGISFIQNYWKALHAVCLQNDPNISEKAYSSLKV